MPARHLLLPAVLLLTTLIGCAHKGAEVRDPVQAPASLPPGPVAAVWFEVGYPPPGFTGEMRRLIVGVWGDGKVVWSDDHERGGKPYHTGQIEPAKVNKLVAELPAAGLYDLKRDLYFGPDSSYTVIAAQNGEKQKWLGSWHEPAPKNPNIVFSEQGMGMKPGPEPSPEYQQFIKVWNRSRQLIEAEIPSKGEPLDTLDPAVFRLGRSKP